ncbi:MAG: porphobilinogen synthase [Candidatus Omnitrophica bacterium]|nr:porphobilinogen synthase [Candidatus Omnitrophota bacterium]
MPQFPIYRHRRMRMKESLRRLVRETHLGADQFVMPYFVRPGFGVKEVIESMPGQYRFSTDTLLQELDELQQAGIGSVLLFGVPEESDKSPGAESAWQKNGVVQKAVHEIKRHFPDLLVITDVCLCAYTSHGHCGFINERGEVDNDSSLKALAEMALSHAEAGADLVAPSDMMDGRIQAIRKRLDESALTNTPILSYSAKYASAFYGPFRDAAHSAPSSAGGQSVPEDRKSYQMDPANRLEALREIEADLCEGADMVMVKPALAYLDIIREAKTAFNFPLAAYAVSGEYAMVKTAVQNGLANEKKMVMEMMTSLARAGSDVLITYHAKQIGLWNQESKGKLLNAVRL